MILTTDDDVYGSARRSHSWITHLRREIELLEPTVVQEQVGIAIQGAAALPMPTWQVLPKPDRVRAALTK